jgi:hypothetical protein
LEVREAGGIGEGEWLAQPFGINFVGHFYVLSKVDIR